MNGEQYINKNFDRAVRKTEAGEDHFRARSAWSDFRHALSGDYLGTSNEASEREALYHMMLVELGRLGVVAEIYARRGDLGSGVEDSTDQLRVIERNGTETGSSRLPLSGYQIYVVRASSKDL